MRKSIFITFIIFLIIGNLPIKAQRSFVGLQQENYSLSDTTKIAFAFQNILFFKNNEYFTRLWPGYTLPGNSLRTDLLLKPSKRITLNVGFQWVYFYGREKAFEKEFIWGAHFNLNEKWQIISGNLNSALNHKMLEQMLNPENVFLHPQEKGLQFLYHGKKFSTDIWIDWEQFIYWQDDFQEHFTQGTSSNIVLLKTNKWKINLPIQTIATHHGGQIDASTLGVETLVNTAAGYSLYFKPSESLFFVEQYLLAFYDFSPEQNYPFTSGRAFLSKMGIQSSKHFLSIGYWFGDYFLTTKGNPLFNNYNSNLPKYIEGQRSIVLLKYEYRNFNIAHFKFTTGFDVYYDIFNSYFEYSYGIYFNLHQFYPLKN